ncbi:MAG TPA: NAD(P)-binding protein, partial [Thermoleophilaceae bacterium]|nr:NAD(P)-binding protein [Thermoleophilaceae bacterium]
MDEIKVVGGGIAGLVGAITAAERGVPARLFEAHSELGGRARSAGPPYYANLGPHVLYKGGSVWSWLAERELLLPTAGLPLAPIRLRHQGELRRRPPLAAVPAALRLRGRRAPDDIAFRDWVGGYCEPETAELLSMAAGVYTFHHDPGELSAAFVWERTVRTLL